MAKKSRSRSRRQPNRRVVVASAAVAVAAVASANTAVTAFAFSPPLAPRATLSSREGHCSANYSNNVNFIRRCAATTASASTVLEDFQQRGPLHVNYCGLPQIIMQNEQQKQQQWSALVGKSNVRRSSLSSLSGQYGGFGSSLDNTNNNGSLRKDSELSVSRSSDNVLGFRVEDFEQFDSHTGFAPSDNNDVDDELNELSYRAEDFEHYQAQQRQTSSPTDLKIRKLNPRKASATKNRAAASLFRSRPDGSTVTSSSAMGSKKTKSNAKNKKDDVPPWLPWIPTESQIMAMKVVELRAACAERGLVMTGLKADLQQRMMVWATVQDRKRVEDRLTGLKDLIQTSKNTDDASPGIIMSSYDVDALTKKRQAMVKDEETRNKAGVLGLVDETFFANNTTSAQDTIDEEEEEESTDSMIEETNLPSPSNGRYIFDLSRAFNAPSPAYSNRDVREMYLESKAADQAGNRRKAKAILTQLREATPHDMRVVRRLARMEEEDGNLATARKILQHAIRKEPTNSHLLHGLGQLERKAGNDSMAIKYYRRAIKSNPTFPNPYHALGTLEHSHGNIKAALSVLKEGLNACPQNHRMHHALGDVYLDAKALDLAENSYLAGMKCGPHWGRPFVYTSLSYVSYEKGLVRDARIFLQQALLINGGMHAQGVIALAQLEESEGNIEEARRIYRDSVMSYEKKRQKRSPFRPKQSENDDKVGGQYTASYSGDKWINVFKSWARMEEMHGSFETAHIAYSKAARLFPNNASLLIKWAQLQAEHGDVDRARLLFEASCHRLGDRSAEPYRLFAEFEMKRRNFIDAQSILFRGAQVVSESSDSSVDVKSGLAALFHTWGVCEFHLGNNNRAELLFDDALRVTGSGEADCALRSLILYSMARLEFSREEYILAQHCIGLSLKENLLPGGNSLQWRLWAKVAEMMSNDDLAQQCREQALLREEGEKGGTVSDLSRLFGERDSGSLARLPERTGSVMKDMLGKSPWYIKIHPQGKVDKSWHSGVTLWEL